MTDVAAQTPSSTPTGFTQVPFHPGCSSLSTLLPYLFRYLFISVILRLSKPFGIDRVVLEAE